MTLRPIFIQAILLLVASTVYAEDLTFRKSKLSSPTDLKETTIAVTITDSAIHVANYDPYHKYKFQVKTPTPTAPLVLDIPYASISRISYGLTDRRRILEGLLITPWLFATKAASHWLVIEAAAGSEKRVTLIRLDKSEYRGVLAALNARSGKHVEVLDPSATVVDPTVGSVDIDEVLPYSTDAVFAALAPAMNSMGCKAGKRKGNRMECGRARLPTERTGMGGEHITATLEAQGQQTRVKIETYRGFGRNWSTPIYKQMRARLEQGKA